MEGTVQLNRDLFQKSRDGGGPGLRLGFQRTNGAAVHVPRGISWHRYRHHRVKMCHMALSQKPNARRDDCENSERQHSCIHNDANDQLTPRE
jgi:hypothetical protein